MPRLYPGLTPQPLGRAFETGRLGQAAETGRLGQAVESSPALRVF